MSFDEIDARPIRQLVLSLLNDNNGISLHSWNILRKMLDDDCDADIFEALVITEGRVYLLEEFFAEKV